MFLLNINDALNEIKVSFEFKSFQVLSVFPLYFGTNQFFNKMGNKLTGSQKY